MLWHNRLLIISEILNKHAPQFIYRAVISNSRDGELLAILANSYSAGRTLRVPHNARYQALQQMISHLKSHNDILIITPDGPRGPRYKVKPGIAIAAHESQADVIPLSWTANRYWQLNTWDQMMIPKPFSHIEVKFDQALKCDTNESKTESILLQKYLKELD